MDALSCLMHQQNGKNRALIDLLVNYPSKTMVIQSVNDLGFIKGLKLFELLDFFVEEIGEQIIVKLWPTTTMTMSCQVKVFNCSFFSIALCDN